MKKEKFLDSVLPGQRKLYSLNLLMAQLKEFKQQDMEKKPETDQEEVAPCGCAQYNTKLFVTYDLYKPISTILNESVWEFMEKKRNS